MAEIDPVILQIRADMEAYKRELQASTTLASASFQEQQRAMQALERQIASSSGTIGDELRGLAGTFAATFSAQQIMSMADSYTRFTNQLRQGGLEGSNLVRVQDQLFAVAQRNMVPLEDLGTLYGRVAQSAGNLGANQDELMRFTRSVSAALRINGGTAESTSGALMQLGQALGGVKVTAEEYNSIQEGARPILQAAALGIQGMGGDVNKLRQEMLAGRLESKEMFDGIVAGMAQMEERAARATPTISGAFTVLSNSLTRYVGQSDASLGGTARMSQALIMLADNIETVVNALTILAVIFGARYVAGVVAASAASGAFGTIMLAMAARIGGAVTTMQLASFAARSLGASMLAAVGGPVGIAVAALAAGIYFLATRTETARVSNQKLREDMDRARVTLAEVATQGRAAANAIQQTGQRATTAAGQMRDFAGATGEAARQLQELATRNRDATLERIHGDAERLRGDRTQLQAELLDLRNARGAGPNGPIGGIRAGYVMAPTPREQEILRYLGPLDRRIGRLEQEYGHVQNRPLDGNLSQADVARVRGGIVDPEGQLRQITADLVFFTTARNEVEIQRLQADREMLKEYQRLMAAGDVSPGAANTAAQAHRARYVEAQRQGNARRTENQRRTPAQAFADFEAALRQRGVVRGGGRTGYRTTRDQQEIHASGESPLDGVRRPSRHQNYQALDPSRATHDEAKARAAAAEAGLTGFRIVRESGGRFHYEWQGHSNERGDVGTQIEESERLAQEARQAEEAERQRQDQVRGERQQLEDQQLAAWRALTLDVERQEELASLEIELARERYNEDLIRQVARGELTASEAEQLKALNDQNAALRLRGVDLQRQARLEGERIRAAERVLETESANRDNQEDLLQAQVGLARTAAERRVIELRLLELGLEEARARERGIIAQAERVQASQLATAEEKRDAEAEAGLARSRLTVIDRMAPLQREGVRRDTRGAREEFMDGLQRSSAEMDEEFDRIATSGLQAVNDQLVDAIMNGRSLGEVFSNMANSIISDLLRIAIQQAIIKPLAETLFGGTGTGSGSGGGLFSSAMSFLGFGGSPTGGVNLGNYNAGRASGGYVGPGQAVRVNEGASNGRVEGLVMGGQGGTVIPLGRMNATAASGAVTKVFNISVSADHSVTPDGFADGLAQRILQEASRMDGQAIAAQEKRHYRARRQSL